MNTQKQAQSNTQGSLPLFTPTQGKASGLAYTAAVGFTLFFSLLLTVVLLAMGLTQEELDGIQNKDWYIYLSFALPQLAMLITAAVYFIWLKRSPIAAIKSQKCHPKYYPIAIALQLGLLSLGELNALFISFLERFGYVDPSIQLPSLNGFGFVGVLFAVAVVPAIFEEIFFRGILLKGLRSFGTVGAVLLCGVLFSVYHQNPAQTIYQFLCGAAFALVAIRSGSILPTVVSHFINNALIVVLEKFGVTAFPLPVYIVMLCVEGVLLVGSLVYLIFFDKPKKSQTVEIVKTQEEKRERARFFVCAALGIAVCAVNWLSVLLVGFMGA